MSNKTFVTPKGTARWPKINKPDTKFDEDGVYTVDLILEGKDSEALIEQITKIRDEGYKEFCTKEKKAKLKLADLPFKAEEDDAGNETGRTVFRFKLKAKGKSKDGSKYDRKVAIFDAKGKPTKAEVWGGSGIKVSYEPRPWFVAMHGVGVSLQLRAVQIIDLVTKGSGDSKSFGFGEEDGYVEEKEQTGEEQTNAEQTPPVAEDGDF
jgi:hypothetical protein